MEAEEAPTYDAAMRARWEEQIPLLEGLPDGKIAVYATALRAVLNLLDAQAARLAALREWAVTEQEHWEGQNGNRYWQMRRVVAAIDKEVRAERQVALPCPRCGQELYDRIVWDLLAGVPRCPACGADVGHEPPR